MTACWRCGRTDVEQKPADPALHPDGTVECVDHMDCVRVRWEDKKPGPDLGEDKKPGPDLGEQVKQIYQDEYRKHRACDPPCLDAKQAAEHLIASGINPAEVA